MDRPIWTVTGRKWSAATRSHSELFSIDFERAVDATGFAALNADWVQGIVIDRNAAAIEKDKQ